MDRGQAQEALLVLTTCDSAANAAALAEHLVGRHLAACVNTLGPVQSTYWWQDGLERATEALLLIKTTAARYTEVEAAIRERSGYELPEVIAVPIAQGLDRYLDWVRAATRTEGVLAASPSDDDVREG
jgi:periplasmic divalent cation tolerance protein